MADRILRKKISSSFKLHGFTLRADSCTYLVEQFEPLDEGEFELWLEKLIDHIQNQRLSTNVVELKAVELAVRDCASEQQQAGEDVFCVISAFDVPRFNFNPDIKKYEPAPKKEHSLFDNADAKAQLFRDRFSLIKQLTERHPLFKPSADDSQEKFKIYPIEHLLSSARKLTKIITMGLFSQLKVGMFHLEDPTGIIQLDLSETSYHVGLHAENCIVLAEGWYEDKIFHAKAIGFPPAETADVSRAYLGSLNMFGGDSRMANKSNKALQKTLRENKDRIMVFLSDLWLDQDKVLRKLQVLFEGLSSYPPIAFIFMGNFLSTKPESNQAEQLKFHLRSLADLISSYPNLLKFSKFVFVPGLADPACPNILPRPPLPKAVTEDFELRVSNAIFTTNPCRIRYCTQEIIVMREDIMSKLCRNTVHYPTTGNIYEHFAKTLLSQANLCPLPLSVRPIYWSFAHAMQIHPAPDLIVVGDTLSTFKTSHAECQVANPGSFAKNNFMFVAYCPGTKQVDESEITD
ncbi:DNA polymerase epsilon subunit 2 [Neocloeon triangulifer]|uniref:DNA polymerase epsilon subunit 2 n=1 Tax=Neocloeon triangulifer TaxID=2078957 RepID=UPI00286F2C50|nr:DNA polymerase epsilon subunit 2 [Neocloeon triangulifer]